MTGDRRLLIAVAMTGLTALALEVLWSRAMIPWVGGTALSQITTVAVYMTGLFVGSALAVPWLRRVADPRRAFFLLEIGAALLSLAAVLGLPLADPLFAFFSRGELLGSGLGSLLRGLAGGGLMLPATILMGLSFPFAIAALEASQADRGNAALTYGVNTLGATAGTLLGGFLLVPALGVIQGALAVVVVDLGVLVWAGWARGAGAPAAAAAAIRRPPPHAPAAVAAAGRSELPFLISITLGGAVALGLEAVLFRVLGLLLGPTARAFTVVLAVYVLGLGLGSLLVRRWVARDRRTAEIVYLACWIVVGVLGLVIHLMAGRLSDFVASGRATAATAMSVQLVRRGLIAGLVLLPLTTAFGASYSAAVAAGPSGDSRRAGRLYAALTLGNIVGLVLAAWLLLPRFGLDRGLLVVLAAAFVAPVPALLSCGGSRAGRTPLVLGLGGAAAVALVALPAWPLRIQHSAAYMYDRVDQASAQVGRLASDVVVFHRSAFETTVSVVKLKEDLYLQLDGKTTGSTDPGDQATQGLLGALPVALHPDPKRVFVIGAGTGQTPGEVLRHPVELVDCAEISPEVVETLPLFGAINRRCDLDPRCRMLEVDGRTVLRYGVQQYDLVISEPSNVWIPGVAHLFTQESFADARRRLEPDHGLCVQWLQGYTLDVDTLRTVVRTFLSVFPHTTLWLSSLSVPDIYLIGSGAPLRIDPAALARRLEVVQAPDFNDPARTLAVDSLLRCYIAGPERLREFAGAGPFTSDARPSLEYAAERGLLGRTTFEMLRVIAELSEPATALLVDPDPALVATLERRARANQALQRHLATSEAQGATMRPSDFGQLHALGLEHPDDRQLRHAIAGLLTLAAADGFLQGAADSTQADLLRWATDLDPDHPRLVELSFAVDAAAGRIDAAFRGIAHFERVAAPWRVSPRFARAQLVHAMAVDLARRGNTLEASQRLGEAATLLEEVLSRDPTFAPGIEEQARLLEFRGDLRGARDAWRRLAVIDPESQAAAEGIARVDSRSARSAR